METTPTFSSQTAMPRHCKRCGIRIVGESVSFGTQGLDGDFCSVRCLESALVESSPTTPPEPQAGATPDLAAIQARCEGAYPSVQLNKEFPWIVNDPEGREIASFEWNTDAEFYVHARADMLALLAALATSRAETEEARRDRDKLNELSVATMLIAEEPRELWDIPNGSTCPTIEAVKALRAQLATLTATLAQREAEVEHWKSEMNQLPALVKARTERDTALARVRELEAAMDELKRRLNALETDVYKYQNQCDPEEAIPAYITGEIERISKSASDAAARAAGKGEEGAGV